MQARETVRMKKLSIVYPCYEQHQTLNDHIKRWNDLPADVRSEVEFIVVDDGSPTPVKLPERVEASVRLFRVLEDIPWNYGAKNLGVQKANNQWVFLSELDHVLDEKFIRGMLNLINMDRYVKGPVYYMFDRKGKDKPHPATYLFDTRDFWSVNGLEEAFSGHYGHDDTYLVACLERAGVDMIVPEAMTLDCIMRGDRSTDAEPSRLKHISRDTTHNDELLARRLISNKISVSSIRFDWELVDERRFIRVVGSVR